MSLEELQVCRPLPQYFLGVEPHTPPLGGVCFYYVKDCHVPNLRWMRCHFIHRRRNQLLVHWNFALN